MGLLDHRESPTYSPKLEKYRFAYNAFTKLFTIRKNHTGTGIPQKGVRIFTYHLLVQQGVPGGVKAGLALGAMVFPVVALSLLSGMTHVYRKDPYH